MEALILALAAVITDLSSYASSFGLDGWQPGVQCQMGIPLQGFANRPFLPWPEAPAGVSIRIRKPEVVDTTTKGSARREALAERHFTWIIKGQQRDLVARIGFPILSTDGRFHASIEIPGVFEGSESGIDGIAAVEQGLLCLGVQLSRYFASREGGVSPKWGD